MPFGSDRIKITIMAFLPAERNMEIDSSQNTELREKNNFYSTEVIRVLIIKNKYPLNTTEVINCK